VGEHEAEEVLRIPLEDRPGKFGSRVAIGRTEAGRILRVIYIQDQDGEGLFSCDIVRTQGSATGRVQAAEAAQEMSDHTRFPPGWDEERVGRLIEHYEGQSDDEAVAEDEAAFGDSETTFVEVPKELVPEIRRLIAHHRAS
jgi:hypothetical protein